MSAWRSGLQVVERLDGRTDGEARERSRSRSSCFFKPGDVIVLGHRSVGLRRIDVGVDEGMRENAGAHPGKAREELEQEARSRRCCRERPARRRRCAG